MGAVTSKVVMYKQVLLLVGLVFLSTSVRSHPVKPAADKEAADTAAEKAPEAAGDEAAAPSPADAEKGEAPAPVEETGDAAEAPSASEGGHVAESKIDDAIQKMNELNDLFEEIVQSLGGKTADADEAAGDAAADGADAADPAADGAAADAADPAADADGAADGAAADTAADADAAADGAAADTAADGAPAGDAATDAKADAKKV